jgi:hypothetical protein
LTNWQFESARAAKTISDCSTRLECPSARSFLRACLCYGTTRRLIVSISATRSASAAASSLAASFAVLLFEPHTTMPPSNAATAPAIVPRSKRIAPRSIAPRTMPPPNVAMRDARINLRQFSILAESRSICRLRLCGDAKFNAPRGSPRAWTRYFA